MKFLYIPTIILFFNLTAQVEHLKNINSEFKISGDLELYNTKLQNLSDYYEKGEYERELSAIFQKSFTDIFTLAAYKDNSIVIFDIDETALTDYYFFKDKNFDWTIEDVFQFRKSGVCTTLKPVLNFYKNLQQIGLKIIFITSRRSTLQEATEKNLKAAGYTDYEELILLPIDLFNQHVKHEEWKAQVRAKLSEKYDIIASISDSNKDFEGGNTGYCIKLPNYLY